MPSRATCRVSSLFLRPLLRAHVPVTCPGPSTCRTREAGEQSVRAACRALGGTPPPDSLPQPRHVGPRLWQVCWVVGSTAPPPTHTLLEPLTASKWDGGRFVPVAETRPRPPGRHPPPPRCLFPAVGTRPPPHAAPHASAVPTGLSARRPWPEVSAHGLFEDLGVRRSGARPGDTQREGRPGRDVAVGDHKPALQGLGTGQLVLALGSG